MKDEVVAFDCKTCRIVRSRLRPRELPELKKPMSMMVGSMVDCLYERTRVEADWVAFSRCQSLWWFLDEIGHELLMMLELEYVIPRWLTILKKLDLG
eukprot:scaffold50683_cov45-Cyclotella_meneghiniana.AAC.2